MMLWAMLLFVAGHFETWHDLSEVMGRVNDLLCEGNESSHARGYCEQTTAAALLEVRLWVLDGEGGIV